MSETNEPARRRTAGEQARAHHSWWPGWIWIVPVAAVAITAWLLFRHFTQGGTDITITFSDSYKIDPTSTTIEYRGMTVGHVTGVSLTKDKSEVKVSANMLDESSKLLTSGTLFWLSGAHPNLSDLSSLGAVLSGPTIVLEAGDGKPTREFAGQAHKPAVPLGSGAAVVFAVSFDGSVGDLAQGDAVKLRGFPVGEVRSIGFHYDGRSGAIVTPVRLSLYPSLFHIEGGERPDDAGFKALIDRLVGEGLRADLERDPPLIGGYRVGLEMVPDAPVAKFVSVQGVPEIPAAPAGGLQSFLAGVGKIPLGRIGQNVLDLTHHADELFASPKLKESVSELDASLKEIHQTLQDVAPKIDKLVETLRQTAEQLDKAAAAAGSAVGGPASQAGLQDTLREIKDAARSIRSLADYLEQHPESLISGKHGK